MKSKALESQVHYQVTVDQKNHEIAVEVHLTGPIAKGDVRLEIPTWVPGDYSFATLARDLFDIRASSPHDEELEVSRDGWQAFIVHGGKGEIKITYRASACASEFGESSGIVDNEYAILLGARYLHCPAFSGACMVTYAIPKEWQGMMVHHPSGAEKMSSQPGTETWRYPSYEILLDTPVVMGKSDRKERVVHNTPFYFVFVDRGVGFQEEVDAFVDKVAEVAKDMFGIFEGFPFTDYTFVLSLSPKNDWGLEHLTSSMCGLDQDVFTDPDKNAIGVRVCAHELLHAWNVRRLRPAPLGCLAEKLTSGCFTEGLWLAEGFTRYYEFLSCTRTKVYSPNQFFSTIVGYFEHLRAAPAYQRVSGIDSSLTAYLNHSPKYSGRMSNAIDYYDHGMLVAFEVDAALRFAAKATSTLDEAMHGFYRKYVGYGPGKPGYTTEDALDYFTRLSPEAGRLIAAAIKHPGKLEVQELLTQMGFTVEEEHVRQLGIVFEGDGAPTIYDVLDDSPAGKSGIAAGDSIVAINGFAYTASGLAWAARGQNPVMLDVTRGHRRLSFTMTPEPKTKIKSLIWGGSDEQAKRIQKWLGSEFACQQGDVISLDFYENFHGIETVR